MSVAFLDLSRLHDSIRPELDAALDRVIKGSSFIGGDEVAAFEVAFGEAHGLPPGVGCGSGTDALALALRALGLREGDEVVVPSMTFVATAEAVVHAGGVPVVADVAADTLLLDEASVAAVRTPRTRAVVPVHLYGHVVPFDLIRAWRDSGLIVLEDAAQAHVATWEGETVGTAGHAACFSFYPGKNLGALGDGGAILSSDPEVLERARILANHGRRSKYLHDELGWCSRLDGMQAALLNVKLSHLPAWTAARQARAARYAELLPDGPLVPWTPGAVHHLLVARVADREAVRSALRADGIGTGVHYPASLAQQPWLAALGGSATPNADLAAAEVLSLPMDPMMTDAEVESVVAALDRARGRALRLSEPTVTDGRSPAAPGWGEGTARRFLALAGGRATAQVLATVWFFAAARILSDSQFGIMATGLAFFVVFAGIGDVGTTRTIVRHVAADHSSLWPTFRRAAPLRIAGGLVTGVAVAGIVLVLPVSISGGVVLLAGLIATASGVTELAYAGLRSVGRVRVETTLLVAERAVFLAVALIVLSRGGGAVAVLLVYLVTNSLSAIVASIAVHQARSPVAGPSGALLDGEARYTAASFAIVTVGPQIAPVLLALLVGATAVGVFSVAQSPIEGMTLFALSTAAPLLPILRAHLSAGRREDAAHAAVSVVTALTVALTPVLVWFEVSPGMALRLFYGAGRYEGAQNVLRLLAVTALAWCFRGVAEFVLLGDERARRFLWITIIGAVITIVIGVPLVLAHESVGAAAAVLVGELAMTVALLVSAPILGDRVARRAYAPVLVAIAVSAIALVAARSSTAASVAVVVVLEAICGLLAIRSIRRIEHRV